MKILHHRRAIQLIPGISPGIEFGRAARAANAMLLMFAIVTLLGACASLPENYDSPQSFVVADSSRTSLARQLAPQIAEHPQKSGFFPLISGNDALVARAGVMQAAELTLDVQYYIWHTDTSGRLLVELLLQAADRGVRVRILLDDLDTEGKDLGLVSMNAHPNIEIRLFNAFADRGSRVKGFLTDLRRVNRRMHNKSLTADNQVTIVGGRNIGNEYFVGKSDTQFSDLDVLAIGPVVSEVSSAFDTYWNSAWVIPVSAFDDGAAISADDLDQARADLVQYLDEQKSSPYAEALQSSALWQKATFADLDYSWGEASLLYDAPSKAEGTEVDGETHIGPHLLQVFDSAQQELIIISPYFVPGKELVEYFGQLVDRGVRVRILTNSLASNDVSMVHAGYMRYRIGLLKNGVELYEFKPVGGDGEQEKQRSWAGSSKASLHTKLFGVDRKLLFVGSFNLDPRSVLHNTEMGVLFESSDLAGQIGDGFDNKLLQKAYRVQFRYEPDEGDEKSAKLDWVTEENGSEVRYHKEPETSFFQRFSARFLSIFVLESML